MYIFDSVKRAKVPFEPIVSGEARVYLCGPTVYDNAHLGHARSALAFDLLMRVLEANGVRVIFMRNFTDIDDKIARKCRESGKSASEITALYIENYLRDMGALGIKSDILMPKVSQNLDAIFKMIESLLGKNLAYRAKNGDIYMRVSADSKYGNLSQRAHLEEQISRIGENEFKEDSRDFALWKIFEGADEVAYDSPFGRGRPGWHIECSAMIEAHLAHRNAAFSIDIHGGGSDLFFPHHENEACQSRCANGIELAKYWMHNGFVNIDGEKMSKSLGNSFFINDALKRHDGEVLRYYLLGTHYRAPLHFSDNDVSASKKRLDKIYRFKQRIARILGDSWDSCESLEFGDSAFKDEFLGALNDDLNISVALSAVDAMISRYNEAFDKDAKDKNLAQKAAANLAQIRAILGIGAKDSIDYFHLGADENLRAFIEEKIRARSEAKRAKNYALSDKIRDELKARGVALLDTKDGTVWEFEA